MTKRNGLTYADAGVDIDAGNRLVDMIKPLVRATARPGADAEIGGFGGLFDPKAAGFKDPVLVAATDGVGTKLKIAIEADLHDGIGVDLVAMCVNDLVVQGAEPLFFLDYFATGRLDPEAAARDRRRHRAGLSRIRLRADRRRDRGDARALQRGDYDLAGFAVGAAERGTLLPRGDVGAGDVVIGLASSGLHSNGFSLVRGIVERTGLPWSAPAPFAPALTLGAALLTPTQTLREVVPARDPRHRRSQGAGAHHRRRLHRQHSARAAEGTWRAHRPHCTAGARRYSSGWRATGGVAELEMLRTFNCGIGMVAVVAADRADDAVASFRQSGETVVVLGEVAAIEGEHRVAYRGALDLRL